MKESYSQLELLQAAAGAREQAYAKYSNFTVGAALLADDGSVFLGCNVENSSFGLTICAERAAVAPLGAVILESPYAAIADVAAKHYPFLPVRWLVKDRFESVTKIARVQAPVFVFHGEKDGTIPIRTARELFAAAVEPKKSLWIAEAYHNDLYDYHAPAAVIAFLGRLFGAPVESGVNQE